jgi:Fic family protein
MYYFNSNELAHLFQEYLEFLNNDLVERESTIISENYEDIIISRLTSELDGTLRIEGVNTTRRQMIDIYNGLKKELDSNDIIIRNMIKGIEYISNKPAFNKENLLKLYNILSQDSLTEETKLDGEFYRLDKVYVGDHEGCPADKIDESMNDFFAFVNNEIDKRNFYLPFIAHFYVLYIHPYYDFNGRTARMVSLWISLLSDIHMLLPTYISEAINDDKNNYYKAIDNSRFSNNDITYFLTYLIDLSNKYYLVYKNLNAIKEDLAIIGESLSPTESYYLKRIMINSKKGWFNYRGFIDFCKLDITKQGALKALNKLLDYGLLVSRINSKNEKIFMINDKKVLYKI